MLTIIGVRASDNWLAVLDSWISDHSPGVTRPEAIRRLVELGLKAKCHDSDRKGSTTTGGRGQQQFTVKYVTTTSQLIKRELPIA
jgi:hypothetical protein